MSLVHPLIGFFLGERGEILRTFKDFDFTNTADTSVTGEGNAKFFSGFDKGRAIRDFHLFSIGFQNSHLVSFKGGMLN